MSKSHAFAAGKRKRVSRRNAFEETERKKRKVRTRRGKMRMQTQKSMIPYVESRALSRLNDL